MSELNYVNYLKEINNKVLAHTTVLNLDFELGSSQLMKQVNILEQYLSVNTLLVNEEQTEGISDLIGFVELPESLWRMRFLENKVKEAKEIQKRNRLFTLGTVHEVAIIPFDTDDIIECEIEEEEDNLFENEDLETVDLFDSNEELSEDIEVEENTASSFLDDAIELDAIEDEDTEEPLLTDIFSDLQKAQNLFDDDSDLEDYQDEYALVEEEEETEEHYPEDEFEGNIDTTENEFETESTDDFFGDMQDFPENNDFDFMGTPIQEEQTEVQNSKAFENDVVDKTASMVNKGLNTLLGKIAKKK